MGKIHFLKLKADYFNQEKLRTLRLSAGGETFTVIYLKLMLFSLQNSGLLMCDNIADLAETIDEQTGNVEIALPYLLAQKLVIQHSETEYEVVNVGALTGSEDISAERVRRFREKQDAQYRQLSALVNVQIKRDISEEIVALYHEKLPMLARCIKISDKRRSNIMQRMTEYKGADKLEFWENVFDIVAQSDFLIGAKTDFKADLEWIINKSNMLKIMEGRYKPSGIKQFSRDGKAGSPKNSAGGTPSTADWEAVL